MWALVLASVLASDGGVAPEPVLHRRPLERAVDEARVGRVLAALSLRERAAQLVLAYPQVGKATPVEVGGILFVGNLLRNTARAKERIDAAVARARVRPFVAVDMEGGPSNRMKSVKALRGLPGAREMAALEDSEVTRWGRRVGEAMRRVGLNLNLAPVLDVAAAGHMARNGRSYAGDRAVVAQKAAAYARGLLAAGVVPIGKHYPGYGDLEGDSDHGLVTADWPRERVWQEAGVFAEAKAVLGGVMLANVAYAAVDGRPAVMSAALVERAHAEGFLAMTDDLAIGVLADAIGGTAEDVVVEAFKAGNDVLLTTAPPDWAQGLDIIGVLVRLAEADPAARAQLDERCLRVLRLKDRMGLLDGW